MYDQKKSKIKYTVAVAAGKGGVGKSTVAVNLALALKNKGFKVGIMDTDLYGPSVRRMLPEDRMPSQNGDQITPALSHGIRMISMAYFRKEHEASAVRAPIANSVITQFIQNVEWGELDYLIVDFPPGTGDIQLTLSQHASLTGALMITTPQEISLMDVRKAMHLFQHVNVPIIGVIENMSYYQHGNDKIHLFGQGGGERLTLETGTPLLAQIPIDPKLCQSGDQGKSIFDKECPSTAVFSHLADQFTLHVEKMSGETEEILQEIKQIDNHTFKITWNDQTEKKYNLSTLQRQCPCAACTESPPTVDDNVKAVQIQRVGRYALRIHYTTGCSNGIYTFDFLRHFEEN